MPLKAYRPPEDPGLWDTYLEWLERALKVAGVHPTTLEYLAHPKRLVTVRGDHYAVYGEEFERCATEARDWFLAHL